MKKQARKWVSLLIIVCMLAAGRMGPAEGRVSAAGIVGDYLGAYVYGAKIVNHQDMPSWSRGYSSNELNFFSVFSRVAYPCGAPGMPGISFSMEGDDYDCEDREFTDKDINHVDGFFRGSINIAAIPELRRVAEGGTAKFLVKVGKLNSTSNNGAYIKVFRNGSQQWYEHSTKDEDDKYNVDSDWISFGPSDNIVIETETNGSGTTVENIQIYFADIDLPVVSDYTFVSGGTERDNLVTHQRELFLRRDQSLDLAFNFSEPVKALSAALLDNLNAHALFMNSSETALPARGELQSMKLGLTATEKGDFVRKLPFRYQAAEFHNTGNNPIADGGGLEKLSAASQSGPPSAAKSLADKINGAQFHDAAGNPLQLSSGYMKAGSLSNSFLAGKLVNPFDYEHAGYRVIIDAVPPRYSLNAKGILPDILTGSALNKGDVIDIKVQLTESAMVKEGENWNANGLYLLFNNGMKAYYVSGENTNLWTFRVTVSENDLDVSLLKVIALTHEQKPGHTDKAVIQDYAGNLLLDSANADKKDNPGDSSQAVPETKIDWAKLSIDNTKPSISFRYEGGGATDAVYGKRGKMTIDASDPPVTTPALDPDEPGGVRPSQGIYRPKNMTGGEAPSGTGYVYYYWSRQPDNPLVGKEADRFAALKRYSLTGLQPREGLYPGELPDLTLTTANNINNALTPPAEAFAPENSGVWYLHAWTADMTWDTARELMQDQKLKNYKDEHPAQYAQWIQEYKAQHPGSSDANAETDVKNRAMETVGRYKDLSVWTAADFKRDDSNWVYQSAAVLLDNLPPVVKPGEPSGNHTAEVKVPVQLEDAHSGLDPKRLHFQWVKPGAPPSAIGWEPLPDNRIAMTLNHVAEDGEYVLYVRAADLAGNETTVTVPEHAVVDSRETVRVSFSPDASANYVKSHPIEFSISGLAVADAVYAFSLSTARPEDKGYRPFVLPEGAAPLGASVASAVYGSGAGAIAPGASVTSAVYGNTLQIPADLTLNGLQYLHIKVKKQGTDRFYYYYAPYRFDNTAPAVSFSIPGVSYPRASHTVAVHVSDPYNPAGITAKYQWVKAGEPAPEEGSSAWTALPEGGSVSIDNTRLSKGETADFILYVYAADAAGNSAVRRTDTFRLVREEHAPIEVIQSDLLYIGGNESDGYYAVAKLLLANQSKDGFEYALSSDNGENWGAWQPYASMIKTMVPTGQAQELRLKAKFRSPSGVVSAPASIDTLAYSPADEPLYGIAAHSTLKPASGGVLLRVTVPAGVKVLASADQNPAPVERVSGNTFQVNENGLYAFDLIDLLDNSRKEQLLVVVKNIDHTPPIGYIEQTIIGPTASNVLVKLHTSEDVRILNNDGSASYTFTENGSFTFQFEDEAGNAATATATVTNIDRAQPVPHIVKSYVYGEQGSGNFRTIEDASGRVVLAQGVTLTVEKAQPQDKDFTVIQGGTNEDRARTFQRENGTVSFTVADSLGNTNVLEETVTHIVNQLPAPDSVSYEFVDDNGQPLASEKQVVIGGKTYAKGRMKVTLKGKIAAPNHVFKGTTSILQGGAYVNRISDETGHYSTSSVYDANGELRIVLADLLGNISRTLVRVEGLDNTPPTITLNRAVAGIVQGKKDFRADADLGGYTVADNVSEPSKIKVELYGLDLNKPGKQIVTYTATDEVGNASSVTQEVVVLAGSGLLITGNGEILSSALGNSALLDRNDITFAVSGYNEMTVQGQRQINEQGRYDVFYQSGLYREGQLKYIARQVTMDQLLNNQYRVVFPEAGWYTLIVRTQEREREYATFFISKVTDTTGN